MLRLEGPRLAEGADQYQCRFGFTRWPAASLRRSAEAARLVGSQLYLKSSGLGNSTNGPHEALLQIGFA